MALPAYAMGRASFPELYERILVAPIFRPWVEDLLERAGARTGARLLDLACGTGIVARLARTRVGASGRVVGVDLSAPMLEEARRHAPDVEWREGDACRLPLEEAFDAVVCQQGFQFFPDKAAAAREIRRVLAREGRAVVATWCSLEESPCYREAHAVAERHLGPVADARFGLGASALERHLAAAGLRILKMETLRKTLRFDDPSAFLRMNAMALVGMSGKALDDAARERMVAAIAADSAAAAAPYLDGGRLAFEAATSVATATA